MPDSVCVSVCVVVDGVRGQSGSRAAGVARLLLVCFVVSCGAVELLEEGAVRLGEVRGQHGLQVRQQGQDHACGGKGVTAFRCGSKNAGITPAQREEGCCNCEGGAAATRGAHRGTATRARGA